MRERRCATLARRAASAPSSAPALLGGFALVALVRPARSSRDAPAASSPCRTQPPSWRHCSARPARGRTCSRRRSSARASRSRVGFAVGLLVTLLGVAHRHRRRLPRRPRRRRRSRSLTNVFLVIPGLPLAIVIAAYLPPGPAAASSLVLSSPAGPGARACSARRRCRCAARTSSPRRVVAGEGPLRIIVRRDPAQHGVARAVGASSARRSTPSAPRSGLEFLGLGDLGTVSWGTNLYWASNDAALLTGAWWTFVPTGVCVALVGFALTLSATRSTRSPTRACAERAPRRRPRATAPSRGRRRSAARRWCRVQRPAGAPTRGGDAAACVDDVSLRHRAAARSSGSPASRAAASRPSATPCCASCPPARDRRAASIRFDGADVARARRRASCARFRWREVSIVFQSAMNALNPVLTVGEQIVDIARGPRRVDRAEARARARRELLELVGIDAATPSTPTRTSSRAACASASCIAHRAGARAAAARSWTSRPPRSTSSCSGEILEQHRRAAARRSASRSSSSRTTCRCSRAWPRASASCTRAARRGGAGRAAATRAAPPVHARAPGVVPAAAGRSSGRDGAGWSP